MFKTLSKTLVEFVDSFLFFKWRVKWEKYNTLRLFNYCKIITSPFNEEKWTMNLSTYLLMYKIFFYQHNCFLIDPYFCWFFSVFLSCRITHFFQKEKNQKNSSHFLKLYFLYFCIQKRKKHVEIALYQSFRFFFICFQRRG